MLFVLAPSYRYLARATEATRQLQLQLNAMTFTILVTQDGVTTTYTNCTEYNLSDNGTVSFKGREVDDDTDSEFVFGHGKYSKVKKTPTT